MLEKKDPKAFHHVIDHRNTLHHTTLLHITNHQRKHSRVALHHTNSFITQIITLRVFVYIETSAHRISWAGASPPSQTMSPTQDSCICQYHDISMTKNTNSMRLKPSRSPLRQPSRPRLRVQRPIEETHDKVGIGVPWPKTL